MIAAVARTGEENWEMSTNASAGTSSNWRLAACIAARQRATRSSGSATSVGSSATSPETRFVHGSVSLPVRIETLEQQVAALTAAMTESSFYQRDAAAVTAHTQALTQAQAELDAAYARWSEPKTWGRPTYSPAFHPGRRRDDARA